MFPTTKSRGEDTLSNQKVFAEAIEPFQPHLVVDCEDESVEEVRGEPQIAEIQANSRAPRDANEFNRVI